MTLIARYPQWLYEAVKLTEPKIPIDLDSSVIQSVLDVTQAGWGFTSFPFFDVIQTGVDPGATRTMIAADPLNHRVLHHMIIQNSSAGPWSPFPTLRNSVVVPNLVLPISSFTLAPGGLIRMEDRFATKAGNERLFLPPDWSYELTYPATIALDVLRATGIFQILPVGFPAAF